MTDEEALKLRIGDPLVGVISGKLAFLEVAETVVDRLPRRSLVRAKRVGKTHQGRAFPSFYRFAEEVSRMPKADAPTALVLADWLDENDEPMAAQKLRRAFPL